MLYPAKLYEKELMTQFTKCSYDPHYKYYFLNGYANLTYELADDTWKRIQFVSYADSVGVIGYLSAGLSRTPRFVDSLSIINFTKEPFTFARDLHNFINMLFYGLNFAKINFQVAVGNPAEEMYDKFVNKFGGRVIGTAKEHVELFDGTICDYKLYEIMKPNIN